MINDGNPLHSLYYQYNLNADKPTIKKEEKKVIEKIIDLVKVRRVSSIINNEAGNSQIKEKGGKIKLTWITVKKKTCKYIWY